MKKFEEGFAMGDGQAGKLDLVKRVYRFIEAGEDMEPGGGDDDAESAAVLGGAAAFDPTAFFEAFEKAGDIGIAGPHAAADFSAGEGLGGAAEYAQDVVLR